MLVRNVGHLMTNPAITLNDGSEVPEGIMDAFITSAACIHDLKEKVILERFNLYRKPNAWTRGNRIY